MSEENKALNLRFWEEGFNQGNMATTDELWSADGVNHAAPPGTPPGPEAVKQLVAKLTASFPGSHLTIEDNCVMPTRWLFRERRLHRRKHVGGLL